MMATAEHEEVSGSSDVSRPGNYVAVDPLTRAGWDSLISAFPQSTIFHGAGWARVLRQTYGHTPAYLCRFEGERLAGLLPIMEVSTPWRGRRGVSLPFTDACAALKTSDADGRGLYQKAMQLGRERHWKYLECRNGGEGWEGATPSLSFYRHEIDLTGSEEGIYERMEGSVRRGVRRAQSAGVTVDFSRSPDAVNTYYNLHCRTRKRHGLPPQPFSFFDNIRRFILEPGDGFVATGRLNGRAVAGAVFFCRNRRALYKFGASDYAFQELRPNNLVMWESIRHCAALGCAGLDLGRTSLANSGLRRFKLNFGAVEETVQYCRYDFGSEAFAVDVDRAEGWFNRVFACLPLPVLRLAGRILYPHLS